MKTDPANDKTLTVAEAARALGVSRTWVYRELGIYGLEAAPSSGVPKRVTLCSVRRRWFDRLEHRAASRMRERRASGLRLVIDNT